MSYDYGTPYTIGIRSWRQSLSNIETFDTSQRRESFWMGLLSYIFVNTVTVPFVDQHWIWWWNNNNNRSRTLLYIFTHVLMFIYIWSILYLSQTHRIESNLLLLLSIHVYYHDFAVIKILVSVMESKNSQINCFFELSIIYESRFLSSFCSVDLIAMVYYGIKRLLSSSCCMWLHWLL